MKSFKFPLVESEEEYDALCRLECLERSDALKERLVSPNKDRDIDDEISFLDSLKLN